MSMLHASRNVAAAFWGALSPLSQISDVQLRNELESGRIRKILFIRPHQGIGDLILATPVFRAFKTRYPDITLHFLGTRTNHAAVKDNPRLEQVWIWDKKAMLNPLKNVLFFQALRKERYDLAMVLISNAPSFTSFLIARLCGAQWIGGHGTQDFYGGTNWSRRLAHWQSPPSRPEDPEYFKFFTAAAPLVNMPCPQPEFAYPDTLKAWAADCWKRLGLDPQKPPIAIFLGGNPHRLDRLWLPRNWARLTQLLEKAGLGPVVAVCPPKGLRVSSGAKEGGFYDAVRQELGHDLPVFDEPGLPQAAAFLKPMRLFICPDGGLFHVAAASGVKTFGLFFSSDPALWKPPIPSVTCIRAPQGDPNRLTPENVLNALQPLLS